MSKLRKAFSYLTGLPDEHKRLLIGIEKAVGSEERKRVESALRSKEVSLTPKTLEVNGDAFIYAHVSGEKELNKKLKEEAVLQSYASFARTAFEQVSHLIAPNLLGLDDIKKAAALQLFAPQKTHLLLLGDPGTGKTDILRSAHDLASTSSMGLGSGTSAAGLSVSFTRGELHKGLLPLADGGICCIDELNLMKKDDRAALYNSMEKGFVSYDKAGHHEKVSADVSVLATANPKNDVFSGTQVDDLRKQLPFESALLSRFHMVFLVRKPDKKQFLDITKKIVSSDKSSTPDTTYAKGFIEHARSIEVSFPKSLQDIVSGAIERIKSREDEYLIEISPRIVKGIIGFSKARARCELRSTVSRHDVKEVVSLLESSLEVN